MSAIGGTCGRVAGAVVCGLIVIDGSQAMLGTTDGQLVQKVGRVESAAASRTRRGGSSAARFARKRDGAELAFLRRVVEKAQLLLAHAGALILGGKSTLKCKLLKEMPLPLRSRVSRVVAYAGDSDERSLRLLAQHANEVHQQTQRHDISVCLKEFLSATRRPADELHCYGLVHTALALKMGAVDRLFLADGHGHPNEANMVALAADIRAQVIKIDAKTEEGALFCNGFQVGALLRWPLGLLEEQKEEDETDEALPLSDAEGSCGHAEDICAVSEASTADSDSDSTAHCVSLWLTQRLTRSLGDASAAAALAAGAEVLLAFDEDTIEVRIIQAVELLREQGVDEVVLEDFVNKAAAQYGLLQ